MDTLNSEHEGKYDYILLDHVLRADGNEKDMLKKAKMCAKSGGILLVSVENCQCIRHSDKGFTLDGIVELFNGCGLALEEFNYRPLKCDNHEKKLLEEKMKDIDASMRPLYEAECFIFAARKV